MEWLNLTGLMAMLALLAPNLLYAARRPAAKNLCKSKVLLALEQLGRYGCMLLMCVHTGVLEYGYAAPAWSVVWLSLVTPLLFLYWVLWMAYFHRQRARAAIALAVVPALVFLASGLLWRNVPLMALSLLFAYAHVTVTRINLKPEA